MNTDYNYYASLSTAELSALAQSLIETTRQIASITDESGKAKYASVAEAAFDEPELFSKWTVDCFVYTIGFVYHSATIRKLHSDLIKFGVTPEIESFVLDLVVKKMSEKKSLLHTSKGTYTKSLFNTSATNIVKDIYKHYIRESKSSKPSAPKKIKHPVFVSTDDIIHDNGEGRIVTRGQLIPDTDTPEKIAIEKEENALFRSKHYISTYIYEAAEAADLDLVLVSMGILSGDESMITTFNSVNTPSDFLNLMKDYVEGTNEAAYENISLNTLMQSFPCPPSSILISADTDTELKKKVIKEKTALLNKDIANVMSFRTRKRKTA